MSKLQAGDVITVQTEAISNDYRACGDFDVLQIDSTDEMDDLNNDFKKLAKLKMYRVEKHDVHKDLAKFGVNIRHYGLKEIKVETTALSEDGTSIKVNGEHIVSLVKSPKKTLLSESNFLKEGDAIAVAETLNRIELDKMKELKEAATNGEIMLGQIVEKGYV